MKYLFIIFLSLSLFSCKKNLPRATERGANTFGCIVDGTAYKCSGYNAPNNMFVDEGVYVSLSLSTNKMTIGADTKDPKGVFSIDIYEFNGSPGIYKYVYFNNYLISKDANSFVKITRFDNNIISGTFQFTTEDGHKVESGRFDIKKP